MAAMGDRYTVISADCHGGGQINDYRDHLEHEYLDDFDAWAETYAVPFEDLTGDDGPCNWDSDRRLADLEADGIVAEVIFPNTIPPFYPTPSLLAQPPPATTGDDLEHRWAGLRAHNRWLADFCARTPGRRAGIAQVMLHDVDAAVDEVRRAHELGLTGGILLPGAPPGSGLRPLYAPEYEPLWSVCEELEMPVNHHSGSAVPDLGEYDVAQVIFLLEVTWWAHRALWHLIAGGVMERHPDLHVVFTEQGSSWVPETLGTLDYYFGRMQAAAGSQEFEWGAPIQQLSLSPSQYWDRQCHVGASFFRPTETHLRHAIGVDSIMWGSDYPHTEASYPFSREALRVSFHDVDPTEITRIVGANAAELYGFDLDALAPIAARVGPTVAEITEPLTDIPPGAIKCPAFQPQPATRT